MKLAETKFTEDEINHACSLDICLMQWYRGKIKKKNDIIIFMMLSV